ncbi:MipA/OmpV family protein [Comamonas sp. MYb21]|uniref:MipA/OmpV family protein n=1 Tax=Comamonas sp. MYb21 TaxID=1848648 RepID=UPI0030DA80D9
MSSFGNFHFSPHAARRAFRNAAACATFAAMTSNALAEADPTADGTQWGLGLAAGVFQQPYAGSDNKNRALPLLYVENSWLRIAGPTADVKLGTLQGRYGSLSFTGRLKYDGVGYEAKDSPILIGMDKRKESFWAGGSVIWNTSIARTSLELLGDASGNSKGKQLQLQVDRRFNFGALSFTPRVQAQWLDKNESPRLG